MTATTQVELDELLDAYTKAVLYKDYSKVVGVSANILLLTPKGNKEAVLGDLNRLSSSIDEGYRADEASYRRYIHMWVNGTYEHQRNDKPESAQIHKLQHELHQALASEKSMAREIAVLRTQVKQPTPIVSVAKKARVNASRGIPTWAFILSLFSTGVALIALGLTSDQSWAVLTGTLAVLISAIGRA